MNYLIKLSLFGLSLAASTLSFADDIDRTLDVDPNGRIDIEVLNGEVTIEGWNKPQVRVVGEVAISDHEFTFETDGSDTKIEHTGKRGLWNSWGSSGSRAEITIYAPRNSDFRIDSTAAEYILKNIEGQVRANSMSGDISLEGGNGNIDLESVSGNVTVEGATGRLNLASVSGDISADGKAKQFDAQTVSGDIRARIGTSNRINLESISGDIDLRVNLDNDARLDADTVSGDIEIEFGSPSINATFDIETGPGGDVRNLVSNHKADKSFSFSGSMKFKLGDGDSDVNLETMSGTIKIDH